MYRTPHKRAAALFLALGLLVAVPPASAVPATSADRDAAADGAFLSFCDTVAAWFTGLLLGTTSPAGAHGSAPFALEAGSDGDPSQLGPEETSDDPTANPQLGSGADPNG